MKKLFLFASALFLSATLFAQEAETELFVAANASVDHTWGQFENPGATWDAQTGTLSIEIKAQSEWQWGNQVFLATGITTLGTNKEYKVSFDIVASTADCGGVTFKAFDDNQIAMANQNIAVTNVVQTWTSEWTKAGAETANGLMVWDFGWDPAQTVTITNISIKERESQAPPVPEMGIPQVPTVDAANVKAIMCETYNNNLGYWPQGWGGCGWVDTCKAGVNFKYAKTMAWDCFASDWQGAGVADYANLHFDIWFAEDGNAPVVKLEFNGTDPTAEITIPGEYKAGWNSVNVNVEETFGKQSMNDLKCLTVKVTKEGGPVAWANILFFNGDYTSTEATGTCAETPVWPEDAPATAPAAPAHDGASILGAALDPSYAFEPLDWPGAMPQLLTFETGETIYYMSKMTWQIYTNWAEDYYDVSGYNMLHVDLYPATGTEIKVTFEGLSIDDGGQGYKNSVVKTLTAGAWNGLDIALSEFPALTSGDAYDFSDIRYFILEGYNAEQSALTVGNVYFYTSGTGLDNVENVKTAAKSIRNGQVVIERNGVRYNMMGAIVK
ncbi:MAG: hypothetical protein MJZ84_05900 [Paludibacteraceae bacterium]|nr:hypothetical protein [Paludibacteraceae bacterium]